MPAIEYDQGSPEWLEWRSGGIGGSDAACIMGQNPWRSAYDLWALKTGRKPADPVNPAMQRGTDLEPEARLHYEALTSLQMTPMCWEHPDYPQLRCSVDGITAHGLLMLEIKCPGKKAHDLALAGHVPDYYFAQMQHCMMVTGAVECHYFSYRPEETGQQQALIVVDRDDEYIERLMAAELDFWQLVITDTPPETDTTDYVINDDPGAQDAAIKCAQARARLAQAKAEYAQAEAELLDYTDDGNTIIGPLKLTRVVRQGNVDWKQLMSEQGLADSLAESYRKPPSSYWKITEMK